MLNVDKSDTKYLNNIMTDLALKLVETGDSHHTNNKSTWIDVIFVDNCDVILSKDKLSANYPNRHNIVSVTINVFYPDPPDMSITFKAINNITSQDLNSHLTKLDWTTFTSTGDDFNVDEGLLTLTNNIQNAIDELAPDKTSRPLKAKYPWINSELRLLKSKCDATNRRYHRTGRRKYLNEYLSLANEYEEQSEVARCAYMHNRICTTLDDGKNFWIEMRKLGIIPTANNALHGFSPEELNAYLSNISISLTEDPNISNNIVDGAPLEGFAFREVTNNDVILAVSHFSSQAKGDDGIPQSIIAKSLPSIANHLTKLFNVSLKKGIFPTEWKKSRILAIKKCSIPSSPSDFRPVALLSFLSKVLEKLVHDQVVNFLTKSSILDKFQTGFRKHHSTQSALIKLTDDIRMGNERQLATILLQFDFSKAFDNVSPSILLGKLRNAGFSKSTLRWFWSYLCGRSVCVASGKSVSDFRDINIGVPQGSVLGPLLFCIYMNDIQDFLDVSTFRLLYADDLQIYVQVPTNQIQQGILRLSESAKAIAVWAESNRLKLNTSRTQAIIFGSPNTIKLFDGLNIEKIIVSQNGDCVSFVNEVKSLGVILDRTLSWQYQIKNITKKVNRALYGLRIIKPCTSQALRKRLVETLVVPHLDYCNVVYSDINNQLTDQLQRLSNSCVRYIFGLRRQDHITPFRRKLNWMSIKTRTNYFAALTLYRLIRMKEPPFLLSLFEPYKSDKPSRGVRKDLKIPSSITTDWGINSFQVKYAHFWNNIPPCIRDLHSFTRFKKSIRQYLYSSDL